MDKLRIRGGKPLNGTIYVAGAKNSALPILFSSLLTDKKVFLSRVPQLQDVHFTLSLLRGLGVKVEENLGENRVVLNAHSVNSFETPYDLVRKMRASFWALGPLLSRFGRARVSLPGGCAIGARPINIHLEGLRKLGAEIELTEGYVQAKAKRLEGNRIKLSFPSVGATVNLMMAAALAKGETVIENAAREPEIVDLANVLQQMGTVLEGAGTKSIRIQGDSALSGCEKEIIGDRIEAGTYLAAGMITRGKVRVEGISPECLGVVLEKFEEAGAQVKCEDSAIELKMETRPQAVSLVTEPFPGFPTDMQAQFLALMSVAGGKSKIQETIFENRFMHVPELTRLGAVLRVEGNSVEIVGQSKLKGAAVMATDLRASASLILAGLAAEGETVINRVYHLDRGYERMEKKLSTLGGVILREKS